jgi:hypothetical protein
MTRFLVFWGVAGFFIPLGLLILARVQGGVFHWPYLALFLWPTLPFYAAGDSYADPQPATAMGALLLSIILNILVYLIVGRLAWSIFGYSKDK